MTISIVTVSYNQGRFLEEAIASIFEGNTCNIQYIVVDPGSTDNSRSLLEKNSEKIDTLVFEKDSGPADGLNNGFKHVRGEILGYLNADDRFSKGALDFVETFYKENPAVDVLCGAIALIDGKGKRKFRIRTPDKFQIRAFLAGTCMIGQQATFFRKSAFQKTPGFNPENRLCWDSELLVEMALAGCKFARTNRVLGEWRLYDETVTGQLDYKEKVRRAISKIEASVVDRGITAQSTLRKKILRLAYKYNPIRHFKIYFYSLIQK